MPKTHDPRRILIAAGELAAPALHALFKHPTLDGWQVRAADSLSQSRFLLQHSKNDALLVSGDLIEGDGARGLAWLAQRSNVPIIYLAGDTPDVLARAYRCGIDICVPQRIASKHPEVLAAALGRAASAAKAQRQQRHLKKQLQQARRHVDRLVGVIWRTTPAEPNHQWFPQRYALERLQDELARTKRHGVPLSLALAEVSAPSKREVTRVGDWLAQVMTRVKRRSDIIGQFGIHGFMLVMVHTGKEGAIACCRRLREVLETPGQPETGPIRSYFGLTSTIDHQPTAACLLRWAEQNLELAKTGKHDRIVAV